MNGSVKMTKHNEAKINDIANIVIMPGDPNRATLIADKYLQDKKLVNNVRGIKAYTGYYKNKRITVMAHGMGMPSASIYAYELFKYYNVDTIIRIGSAGSYMEDYKLGDIILASSVDTPSNIAKHITKEPYDLISAFEDINNAIIKTAKELNLKLKESRVTTMDVFEPYFMDNIDKTNLSVTEMEAYIIFLLAKTFNKKCACLLTIADENYSENKMSSEDREKNMDNMINLALNSTLNL